MHYRIIVSTLSLLLPAFLMAQPFNGDFEEWGPVFDWEEPLGWNSNSQQGYITIQKATDAWAGEYAMRVRSNGPSFEGLAPGLVDHTWVSPGYPASVTAFVKCDTLLEPGKAIIEVFGWKNGLTYEVGKWETDELIPEFQMIEIPLFLGDGVDSLTFRAIAYTFPGPLGYEGFASFVVDQVEEGELVSLTSLHGETDWKLFPNPSPGRLYLKDLPKGPKRLILWSETGARLTSMRSGDEQLEWDLSHLPGGTYWLQLQSGRAMSIKKIILH